jgi:2-C-methyl-D-erythritol 2,4-cyclodiphosphate synthase
MLGPGVAAATDEASILEAAGYPVHVVEGEAANLKVTRPGDIERAAAALGVDLASEKPEPAFEIRTGFGYDVHSFAEGRTLWLGGVQIPYGRGLSGHSDADVLLHAVCDALLGAASMGDIGVLFPDTDAAHKDRPSIEFVQEVRRRLDTEGWRISNVDVALLAEEPRIGPYRERMTAVIADGLMIAPTQINLKATTSEKMGFVGRKEGMACWAVATLTRS